MRFTTHSLLRRLTWPLPPALSDLVRVRVRVRVRLRLRLRVRLSVRVRLRARLTRT